MIENVEVIAKAFESCNNSLPSKFLNCFGESHDSITNLLEEILLVEKKEVSMFSKNLFSKDFKIEEQQSELCLKILNECFKEIKLIRPVIFITDDSKIVSFFPVETQSPKSKKSIMYFLDLSTGIREICKNTKSDIFYNFLLYGDTKHYIKSFIPSLIKLSIVRTPVKNCINNLKWWTIYYVIMLIHYGNDEFLQLDTWGHEEKVENIKSVILTYLDKSQDTIKVYNQYNSIDLKKFFYLNDLIKKGYLKIEKDLLKEIEVINELKFDVVKNKSKEDEKKLLEKKSKLSIEINEIHKNLSECEGFISFKKSEIDTTESKFRRFITGEEKKLTDSGIEKKFEKLRNAILENNSKNLEQLILEEIKKLENQIFQNDLNIKSKSEYLIKLNKSIVENLDKINENELKIQTHKIRNLKLSENLNDINSKINDKKTTFNKINEFDIRKDYFLLIEQIKGSKTNYEMKNFESLREEIEKTDFKLNNSLLNLKESRKNLEQSENQTIQSEYQLNKLNGELAILKNEESEELDKIKTLKKEYADYDTWYYRTYYWSYTTELLAKIKRADSSLNQIKNRLKNKNDEIENLKTTITNLVANVKQNKKGAVELELICQQINQEKINQLNNLKIQKQNILNFISDKLISELDAEALNIKTEIKTNDIEISTSTDLIKNLKKDNQTIEEKLALSDVSFKSLLKTKCEYQDKIKKLTLKLKEEDKDIRKNALETLEYDFQDWEFKNQHIDSAIISNKLLYEDFSSLYRLSNQNFKLLYRGTKDGFNASDFHRKCDGKNNTLTIIKTDKSFIFGGFTGAAWSSDEKYVFDENSFVFSLKNNEKTKYFMNCKDPNEAIYCSKNLGPCFGKGDISIADQSNMSNKNKSNLGNSYEEEDSKDEDYDMSYLLAGSKLFNVAEIEVFQKVYRNLTLEEIVKFSEKNKLNKEEIGKYYETFNAMAINENMTFHSFSKYLALKIKIFKNENELNEMKKLFEFVFNYFDEDQSGFLEFDEFLTSVAIFDTDDRELQRKEIFNFLFDYADKDKNQELDRQEIEKILDRFPIVLNKSFLQPKIESFLQKHKLESLKKEYFTFILDGDYDVDEDEQNFDTDEYNESEYAILLEFLNDFKLDEKYCNILLNEFNKIENKHLKINKLKFQTMAKYLNDTFTLDQINFLFFRVEQRNQDGYITLQDLINTIKVEFKPSSKTILTNIFMDLDSSRDGQISYDEWESIGKVFPKIKNDLNRIFDLIDDNRNGSISFKEFMTAFKLINQLNNKKAKTTNNDGLEKYQN